MLIRCAAARRGGGCHFRRLDREGGGSRPRLDPTLNIGQAPAARPGLTAALGQLEPWRKFAQFFKAP